MGKLERAIRIAKNGKAIGQDEIPEELFKCID